ncbi:MAG: four helix bundle protein [Acidobacteriota bacterium]|nr:four helix bundle protein [Acidobacteriota bacterium]
MGVRTFKELHAWQAADRLRKSVIAATATGPASRDFRFVDQVRRAANSACANTAEGFGRYQHKEFAQFVSIAKGFLAEVQDHLAADEAMGYWQTNAARAMDAEAEQSVRLAAGLIRHLRSTKAPSNST